MQQSFFWILWTKTAHLVYSSVPHRILGKVQPDLILLCISYLENHYSVVDTFLTVYKVNCKEGKTEVCLPRDSFKAWYFYGFYSTPYTISLFSFSAITLWFRYCHYSSVDTKHKAQRSHDLFKLINLHMHIGGTVVLFQKSED